MRTGGRGGVRAPMRLEAARPRGRVRGPAGRAVTSMPCPCIAAEASLIDTIGNCVALRYDSPVLFDAIARVPARTGRARLQTRVSAPVVGPPTHVQGRRGASAGSAPQRARREALEAACAHTHAHVWRERGALPRPPRPQGVLRRTAGNPLAALAAPAADCALAAEGAAGRHVHTRARLSMLTPRQGRLRRRAPCLPRLLSPPRARRSGLARGSRAWRCRRRRLRSESRTPRASPVTSSCWRL